MYQPNFESIARKIIHDSLAVQPGEQGLIVVRSDAVAYGEWVAAQANRIGSPVTLMLGGDELRYSQLMDTPIEWLSLSVLPFERAIRACDYMLSIGLDPAEPQRFFGLPAERLRALRPRNQTRSTAIYGEGGPRWVGTSYPTRYIAQVYSVPWARLYESFWRAMDVDYLLLRERCEQLGAQLEAAQHFTLRSARGATLHFERGDRSIFRDDGRAPDVGNLPAGEVVFSPIETSVEGDVLLDMAFIEGQRVTNLHLHFEGGHLTPLRADYGFDHFMTVWKRYDGDRDRLGEVGIGLNPAVTMPVGYESLDQKSFGFLHLTLGDNDLTGGSNVTGLRLPLYTSQATLYADGAVALYRGRFSERAGSQGP